MSLIQKVREDYTSAFKAGNKSESDILRIVIAALQNAKIAKGNTEELTDEEALKVIHGEAKKIKDSIEQFTAGNREDLATHEKEQLPYVERYLPAQASTEEIEKVIDAIIAETGAAGPRDMGKVMGATMKKLQGKADGTVVSDIVKKKLSA